MVLHDILLAVLIGVNVIVGFLLKRWIDSLKGTVEAQKTALQSVQSVVDTVVTVFKATDPDRWAKEVAVHKELADRKAAAVIEEERRMAEERIKAVDERARNFVNELASLRGEALGAAIRLLADIPKRSRESIVRNMELHPTNEEPLLQAAAELPESAHQLSLNNMNDAFVSLVESIRKLKPPDPESGGMAVR